MKKLLLASTALVASAGFAAADVVVGGDGYFGAALGTYDGDGLFETADGKSSTGLTDSSYVFVYDLDIDVTATGTSDSGLTFGASIDIDDAAKSQGPVNDLGSAGELFVSGDFGTLAMGDIDDAAEMVVGDLAGVGLTGLGDFNETLFLVTSAAEYAGSPVATYSYAVSGLSLGVSVTDDQGWALGAGYDADFWGVGLAYESVQSGTAITLRDAGDTFVPVSGGTVVITTPDNAHQTIGQAYVVFSGVTLKGIYGLIDIDGNDFAQYGVSAAYTWNATTLTAYWRGQDIDAQKSSGVSDQTNNFFGLGAAYDLGGGLALEAGVAQYDFEELKSNFVVADFGISFDF
jgi:outer membrane protein OmpU